MLTFNEQALIPSALFLTLRSVLVYLLPQCINLVIDLPSVVGGQTLLCLADPLRVGLLLPLFRPSCFGAEPERH